jgi:hypothetical protein
LYKNILNREPTSEKLFLHLHLGREDGISPSVAQAEATLAAKTLELQAGNDETSDGSELCVPETIVYYY